MVKLGTCGQTLTPPLPASQLLSTAVFAALTPSPPSLPPVPSLLTPPPLLNPTLFLPMRLSSPPFTHKHTALFFFFPPPPPSPHHSPLGSGFVALARTQLPRTTHLTQPPPSSFVTVEAWPRRWTVYVWWPAAGLSNMTQRDFNVGTSRFALIVECRVMLHMAVEGILTPVSQKNLAPLHLK